jgi:hypothetical protein
VDFWDNKVRDWLMEDFYDDRDRNGRITPAVGMLGEAEGILMTIRDEIYDLVNSLDEERAEEALRFLRLLVDNETEQFAATSQKNAEELAAIAASRPFGHDDPLWNIVGIIDDDGPTDVSENKYHYLAEAYADHQPE